MSISIDVPTVHQDDSADLHYVVNGANDTRNKKKVLAVVLVDPATGNPSLPGGVQAGGNLTIADGADVTQGNKADSANDPTVIGQLKQITANTTGALAHANTFTVPANGTTVDGSSNPPVAYSLQVKGTGAVPTHWNVVLEVSLDGVTYTTVLTHSDTGGSTNGQVVHTTDCPSLYFRSRLVSVTLGSATNIVATVLGTS